MLTKCKYKDYKVLYRLSFIGLLLHRFDKITNKQNNKLINLQTVILLVSTLTINMAICCWVISPFWFLLF